MDLEELKRQRLAHLSASRELVDSAERENRDLTDEERESYDEHFNQADSIEARIKREEALNQRHGVFASPGPKVGRPAPTAHIGMGADVERYSLLRAIRAAATGDWQEAGLEREASAAVAKALNVEPRGFFVPFDWMIHSPEAEKRDAERRDLLKGTDSAGGFTVGEDLLGGSFIDRLRNRMVMVPAGVTILNGLVGDVAIPRLSAGATAYWVAENAAPTESAQTFEQITLAPKTVAAYTDLSRRLIQQSSIDVENMVRNDLALTLALAYDLSILLGTGTSQPTGVRNQTGVTDKSGANGEAISWAEILDLESAIATANADMGRLAYITNSTIRGSMKSTLKVSGGTAPPFIWEAGARPVNDYPCFVTNQIPNDLTKGAGSALSYVFFGNWGDVVLGSWGSLDVLVDPFTGGNAGTVRIIAFNDVDVAVRHAASFVFGYYS